MTAATRNPDREGASRLRSWLEYVVETALDMLDQLDALAEDLEDDEREIVCDDDGRAA